MDMDGKFHINGKLETIPPSLRGNQLSLQGCGARVQKKESECTVSCRGVITQITDQVTRDNR